ncbi:MAG TPA: MFS transporter [Symbiobacteriaceae bacterium]|nr:MFS transporter [Symbiobacteriaceae bacterium]
METFEPLKNRNLRTYLSGQAVSLIGTWMQVTAQSWVVWKLTGSEAALGTVGMMGTIPYLLLGPIAGTLADRWDRRKILVYTQSIAMLLAVVLAGLVWTDTVQLWHVYALAMTLGTVSALDLPAAQAFIGDMAGRDMIRKAVVVNGMIVQVSRVLGPTLAGLVVAKLGAATAFGINALSFVAVIASILAVKATQGARAPGATSGGFREGLSFVRSHRRIQDLMILTGLVTFFIFSVSQILPSFAERTLHGGVDLYGTLMGASGAGALLAVIVIVPWAQRLRRTGLMLVTVLGIAGALVMLFSVMQTSALALAVYFMAGMCPPIILTTNNGLLQVLAPNEMRARLLSLYLMVSFGLQPLSNLWVGAMAEAAGAPWAIRANGLALLLAAAVMLLRPGLTHWEPGAPGAKPATTGAR